MESMTRCNACVVTLHAQLNLAAIDCLPATITHQKLLSEASYKGLQWTGDAVENSAK
jgi:hypothetical protein